MGLKILTEEDKQELIKKIEENQQSGGSGSDANSIVDAEIVDGNLIATWSDGSRGNLGKVVGADGVDGQDGYTPVKGVDYFDGKDGSNGADGEDGVGIETIEQMQISLDDNGENILKITLTNGQIALFKVCNGSKGSDGADGKNGVNGVSPKIVVEKIEGGHGVMVTDYTGTKTFEVMDGVSATHSWNGTTLNITSASGTSSADLKGDTGKSAYEYAQDGGYIGTEEEFGEKLSTEWVNESGLETEVTNQLDGAKADIVTEIIAQLQGYPVFGTVDEDNTITVTSALADGTYTLMYEYVDGTTSEVGTITVGNGETVVIVNLLESAVGAQGTVLNEVGYLDGYYISASAGVSENNSYLGTDSACFATGFMPYTKDQLVACTPIYVKGVAIDTSLSHVRIGYYPSYDYATYIDPIKLSSSYFSVTELGTNYYKITPVNTDGILEAMTSLSDIAYFRLSLNGSGEGVMITVNQEITV